MAGWAPAARRGKKRGRELAWEAAALPSGRGAPFAPHFARGELDPARLFVEMLGPGAFLDRVTRATDARLAQGKRPEVQGRAELMRFIGVVLVVARFAGWSRESLWAQQQHCAWLRGPRLGGLMARARFEELLEALCLGEECPVEAALQAASEARKVVVHPGDTLVVERAEMPGAGPGGAALPLIVTLCVASGVAVRVAALPPPPASLVSAVVDAVRPWGGAGRAVVVGPALTSVEAAAALHRQGFAFAGPAGLAVPEFPDQILDDLEDHPGNEHCVFVSAKTDDDTTVWAGSVADDQGRECLMGAGAFLRHAERPDAIATALAAAQEAATRHAEARRNLVGLERALADAPAEAQQIAALASFAIVDAWMLYRLDKPSPGPSLHEFVLQVVDGLLLGKFAAPTSAGDVSPLGAALHMPPPPPSQQQQQQAMQHHGQAAGGEGGESVAEPAGAKGPSTDVGGHVFQSIKGNLAALQEKKKVQKRCSWPSCRAWAYKYCIKCSADDGNTKSIKAFCRSHREMHQATVDPESQVL